MKREAWQDIADRVSGVLNELPDARPWDVMNGLLVAALRRLSALEVMDYLRLFINGK